MVASGKYLIPSLTILLVNVEDMFNVLSVSSCIVKRKHKFLAMFVNSQNCLRSLFCRTL